MKINGKAGSIGLTATWWFSIRFGCPSITVFWFTSGPRIPCLTSLALTACSERWFTVPSSSIPTCLTCAVLLWVTLPFCPTGISETPPTARLKWVSSLTWLFSIVAPLSSFPTLSLSLPIKTRRTFFVFWFSPKVVFSTLRSYFTVR